MNIAIPFHEDRIAPSFDYCQKALVFTLIGSKNIKREEVSLDNSNALQKIIKLSSSGINVLICGTISAFAVRMLMSNRIMVIPRISGEVDEIIKLYMQEQPDIRRFRMLCGGFCNRFPGRRKRCRRGGP